MKDELFRLIDILGILAFSIAGAFAAMQKRLDIFGILIIAFITAMGGGTLRDLLIGDLPVSWLRSPVYSIFIVAGAFLAMVFHNVIGNFQKTLLVFDSLGLGFFTVAGIQKGIAFGFHPGICIALGTLTGCFGGVIRDISLNNIPLIFQKEIYATACIVGGFIYFLMDGLHLHRVPADIICIAVIFVIRMLAVRYKLSLPSIYKK
ncbi:MAG TPA: trimeric intracellular cation channel family protein [Chitinophagaceae bacterium]|nr:trimeric intracellular cation channel family protein [Chitinophagaceae bacterium]